MINSTRLFINQKPPVSLYSTNYLFNTTNKFIIKIKRFQ